MDWMVLACKPKVFPPWLFLCLTLDRYNGTSDLQLERMNVYFNEVVRPSSHPIMEPNRL